MSDAMEPPWVSAGLDLIVSKRNLTSAKQGVDAGRELGAEAEWGRNPEFPACFKKTFASGTVCIPYIRYTDRSRGENFLERAPADASGNAFSSVFATF